MKDQRILVIDDDKPSCATTKAGLEKNGFTNVLVAEGGKEGWDMITSMDPSIVVLDWKMPEVSGLTIVNRIRMNDKLQDLPVAILSGYLESTDFAMLETLYWTAKMKKPANPILVSRKIQDLLVQRKWYQGARETVFKNEQTIDEKITLIEHSPMPISLSVNLGRKLRKSHQLDDAEKCINLALKLNPDCPLALSEQGKIKLMKGDIDAAEVFLLHANKLLPDDIETLCNLGELHLQKLETAQAKERFDHALTIDPDDDQASSGSILSANIDDFLNHADVTEITGNFASLLNAIGVFQVRRKEFDRGIEHYQAAIKYLSDDESKAKVSFNAGLGYERAGNKPEALRWFKRSLEIWPEMEKAREHIAEIERGSGMPSGNIDGVDDVLLYDTDNKKKAS